MLHIDNLTIGNEFKDSSGEIYKVTSSFGDGKKMYIELERVEPAQELTEEK